MKINIPINEQTFTLTDGKTLHIKSTTYDYDTVLHSCYSCWQVLVDDTSGKYYVTINGNEIASSSGAGAGYWSPRTPTKRTPYYSDFTANSSGEFNNNISVTVKKDAFVGKKDVGSFTFVNNLPSIDLSAPVVTDFNYVLVPRRGIRRVADPSASDVMFRKYSQQYPKDITFKVSHSYRFKYTLYMDFYNVGTDGRITYESMPFGRGDVAPTASGYKSDYDVRRDYTNEYWCVVQPGTFAPADGCDIKARIVIDVENGMPPYTIEQTISFPDKYNDIGIETIPDFTASGQTQTLNLSFPHTPYAVNEFDDGYTTASDNPSVVSVSGTSLTSGNSGTATITVKSNYDDRNTVNADVYVVGGAFPEFRNITRWDKTLTDKILNGLVLLQHEINSPEYESVTFEGYSHNVLTIKALADDIIADVQALANTSGSSADTDISFERTNTNRNWQTALVKIADAITVMGQEQGLIN